MSELEKFESRCARCKERPSIRLGIWCHRCTFGEPRKEEEKMGETTKIVVFVFGLVMTLILWASFEQWVRLHP